MPCHCPCQCFIILSNSIFVTVCDLMPQKMIFFLDPKDEEGPGGGGSLGLFYCLILSVYAAAKFSGLL
jgi:hypothetical protein